METPPRQEPPDLGSQDALRPPSRFGLHRTSDAIANRIAGRSDPEAEARRRADEAAGRTDQDSLPIAPRLVAGGSQDADEPSRTIDELLEGSQGVSPAERKALGTSIPPDSTGEMTASQRRLVQERNSQRRAQEIQEEPDRTERISPSSQDRENLTRIAREYANPDNQMDFVISLPANLQQRIGKGGYDIIEGAVDSRPGAKPSQRDSDIADFRQMLVNIGVDPNDPSAPLARLRDEYFRTRSTERNPLERLDRAIRAADPVMLINYLENEHPQTITQILSGVSPEIASKILGSLSYELQSEVVSRLARMDRVAPEIAREIATVLLQKIGEAPEGGDVGQAEKAGGGLDATIDVLVNLDPKTRGDIMNKLERDDPELHQAMMEFVEKRIQALDPSMTREDIGDLILDDNLFPELQRLQTEAKARQTREEARGTGQTTSPERVKQPEDFSMLPLAFETRSVTENRERETDNNTRINELVQKRAGQEASGMKLSDKEEDESRKRLRLKDYLTERIATQQANTPQGQELQKVNKEIADLQTEMGKHQALWGRLRQPDPAKKTRLEELQGRKAALETQLAGRPQVTAPETPDQEAQEGEETGPAVPQDKLRAAERRARLAEEEAIGMRVRLEGRQQALAGRGQADIGEWIDQHVARAIAERRGRPRGTGEGRKLSPTLTEEQKDAIVAERLGVTDDHARVLFHKNRKMRDMLKSMGIDPDSL